MILKKYLYTLTKNGKKSSFYCFVYKNRKCRTDYTDKLRSSWDMPVNITPLSS